MKNIKCYDYAIMFLLSSLSPETASRYIYWRVFRKRLNLKSPHTFNEKLMWLKLNIYSNNPIITNCSDKYAVRLYVKKQGLQEILIPLIGVWSNVEEIPFSELPNQFVLKCNHGCGYNIICRNKNTFNIKKAKQLLNKWMKEDFWKRFAETNYKNIPRKILCEHYIGSNNCRTPLDYKFYCFNGRAEYVMVCDNRNNGTANYYFFDRNWQFMRINPDGQKAPAGFSLPKPQRLNDMFSYADRLSAPFPFVRTDLYCIKDQIFFGELTFTPAAALDFARLPEADVMFRNLLKLPKLR